MAGPPVEGPPATWEPDEDPALALEARRRVFAFVRENPGSHVREIQRGLGMPTGQLEYHLRYLEERELLTARKDRYYRRYYAAGMAAADKDLLAGLRQEMPRRIVVHLLLHPDTVHKELMAALELGGSTLTFYLKDLEGKGIIERRKEGRLSLFRVRDPDGTVRALITYRRSFLDEVVDHFLAVWFEQPPPR